MNNLNQNEVSVTNFGVEFTPASLAIQNYDAMVEQTKAIAAKYDNLMITERTLKAAKQSRADLRKFRTAIEDKRKEVRREYAKPYDDFKDKVDALTKIIDQAIAPIDEGVKGLEERQRQEREKAVRQEIKTITESRGLEPEDIQYDQRWENKSLSSIERTRQIAAAADFIKSQKEKHEADQGAIARYAKALDVDAGGWLGLVDQGVELTDVMARMDAYVEQQKEEAAAEKKRQEAQAAIDSLHQKQVGDNTIDTDTGEILEAFDPVDLYHISVNATVEEFDALAKYLDNNVRGWAETDGTR